MRYSARRAFLGALAIAFGLTGCNALGIGDEDENEVRVTIVALGADYLDADDGIRYAVTAGTEYEGLSGFAELAVGDIVEIEYASIDGENRRALEIEADGAEDDD